jgi:hypothetical protein
MADFSVFEDVVLGALRRLEVLTLIVKLVEELRPDCLATLPIQVVVSNDDMDSRDEGIIKVAHAVGCQEEDTSVVFDAAEEDCMRR